LYTLIFNVIGKDKATILRFGVIFGKAGVLNIRMDPWGYFYCIAGILYISMFGWNRKLMEHKQINVALGQKWKILTFSCFVIDIKPQELK
jgi:hypothetical protein